MWAIRNYAKYNTGRLLGTSIRSVPWLRKGLFSPYLRILEAIAYVTYFATRRDLVANNVRGKPYYRPNLRELFVYPPLCASRPHPKTLILTGIFARAGETPTTLLARS